MTRCLPTLGSNLQDEHVQLHSLFFLSLSLSLKYSNLKIAKHVAGFSNKRMNVIVGRVSKYSYMLVLKLSTDIDINQKKKRRMNL